MIKLLCTVAGAGSGTLQLQQPSWILLIRKTLIILPVCAINHDGAVPLELVSKTNVTMCGAMSGNLNLKQWLAISS